MMIVYMPYSNQKFGTPKFRSEKKIKPPLHVKAFGQDMQKSAFKRATSFHESLLTMRNNDASACPQNSASSRQLFLDVNRQLLKHVKTQFHGSRELRLPALSRGYPKTQEERLSADGFIYSNPEAFWLSEPKGLFHSGIWSPADFLKSCKPSGWQQNPREIQHSKSIAGFHLRDEIFCGAGFHTICACSQASLWTNAIHQGC